MVLEVVKYGHPALRQKGRPVEKITPELRKLIRDMFTTMEENNGVGLAAPQVAQNLQLAVVDVRGITDRPSTLELNGEESSVDDFMPLVLINPKITPVTDPVAGPEGCLSFPEVFADITRPEVVDVECQNENGEILKFRCGGLLSRCIQHEYDHLQGILFIDRMTRTKKQELKPELDELQEQTKAELKKK
jgi:peptide deformylase